LGFFVPENIEMAMPYTIRLDRYIPLGVVRSVYWHRFFLCHKTKCEQLKMKTLTTTQPVIIKPVSRRKTMTAEDSLQVLKAFYHEARKQLKMNDNTNVSLNVDDGVTSLVFHADVFTLSLIFTE